MNLAYRMRPQTLDEFVGQEHLIGKGKILRKMIETGSLSSIIFWGPPGSGKTTLAHLIAKATNAKFYHLSAVETGKADLQKITKEAEALQKTVVARSEEQTERSEGARLLDKRGRTTKQSSSGAPLTSPSRGLQRFLSVARNDKNSVLFIDEIHRWNKAQQDALLPYVESGLITLIGATTENPSFEVISALLSRCRVFVLKSLERQDLETIIDRALTDKERGVGEYRKKLDSNARDLLIRLSGGDARIMLNALEMSITSYKTKTISTEIIKEVFQTRSAGLYDKKADEHYNIISAFIKSMRGSDVDASLYYLVRMLENGEDPKFIARRMIIFASEDIGLADRGALIQANEAFEAVNKIGMPESQLILAHVTIYLASAKKSRAVPNALGRAKQAVYDFPNEPIPLRLRNAPTKLMKNLGYAKNYQWSENYVGPKENQSFLPEKLKGKKFYTS